MAKPPQYYGSIPAIAKAFENDPRTLLANNAMATGSSNAPVAQGGWAVTDGLARIGQALAGAYMTKQQQKKYAEREGEYTKQLAAAAAPPAMATPPAMAPQPAMTPQPPMGGMEQTAQALGPIGGDPRSIPQPIGGFDPNAEHQAGLAPNPAQAGYGGAMGFPGPGASQGVPGAPSPLPAAAATLPAPATPAPAQQTYAPARQEMGARTAPPAMDVSTMFREGILRGGERSRKNKNGGYDTSFKGAVGPAQVMPGTAPEAARLAGVPFDEKLYRTDEAYNLKLGEAYFAKQLETFGDPAKAAAAYNAGPGAVRVAMRKANRRGGSWVDHLPVTRMNGRVVDTTAKYVERFTQSIRTPIGADGNPAQPVEAVGMVQPGAPNFEAVPDGLKAPGERPNAPGIPDEVQSDKLRIARELIATGNPDLMAMATEYLDEGLTEQQQARVLRSEQQFNRDESEYGYEAQDFNNASSDYRGQQATDRSNAQQRNWGRESTYTDQTFTAAENAAAREQQARLAADDRAYQTETASIQRQWQTDENEKDRAAVAAGKPAKNPWVDTASGRKMAQELQVQAEKGEATITSLERFKGLNKRTATGNAAQMIPGVNTIRGMSNPDFADMVKIGREITIDTLGGLGVAISDGDRQYVDGMFLSVDSPYQSNVNVANAYIGIIKRKNDYAYQRNLAELQGGAPALTKFAREWNAFVKANSIIKTDSEGNVLESSASPRTFEEWKASVPRYDANGNRVN